MVRKFLTQSENPQFKRWLAEHPHGFYLNEGNRGNIRRRAGAMILHKVGCHHLGTGEGVITTTYAKAASDDRDALIRWAEQHGLSIVPCSSCKPD